MVSTLPPKHRRDFHVAIICALRLEADAVEALFDIFWDQHGHRYGKASEDTNSYRTGIIGDHNVVLAYMPDIGKGPAVGVAVNFRSSFPGIRLALMVGICGGVPNIAGNDIFLGDVIITDDIVIYDFGKRFPAGFRRREAAVNSAANVEVRAFLNKVQTRKGCENLLGGTNQHLTALQERIEGYRRPAGDRDQLFESTYHHKHHGTSTCKKCKKDALCPTAEEATCETLECDRKRLVVRSRPSSDEINIHFGRIGSGDTVMKSGEDRDRISAEEDVIAFEMEGAGICRHLPCIVVKGVCDYADSHKDKRWQKHTAAVAAACMKSLLEEWATVDEHQGVDGKAEDLIKASSSYLITPPEQRPSELPGHNKAYESSRNENNPDDDLIKVLPTVESSFKASLACSRRNRKYIPRDFDLKTTLKTQRIVFSDHAEILSSDGSGFHDTYLGLSNKICLELLLEIRSTLVEIEDIMGGLSVATKAKVQDRTAVNKLKGAVEDLKSLVQAFASSISQTPQVRQPALSEIRMAPNGGRDFLHFRTVQTAAGSLYDALATACNAHAVHDVHLSLQPDMHEKRVRFNVAFIQDGMVSGKAIWINVESTIKPIDSDFQLDSAPLSGNDSQKRPRNSSETNAPLKSRKRVQFHTPQKCVEAVLHKEPIVRIPKLYLQRDFCALVERCFLWQKECSDCIGLLGDNDLCKHFAYMGNQTNSKTTSTSLSQLIAQSGAESTKAMGLYERVRLSRSLATAVLYYHSTPWLNKAWRSDDVQFFGYHHHLLQQAQHVLPYMTTSIQAPTSIKPPPRSSVYDQLIRNPVLFGLGVMLLELAYQAPLRDLQQPIDLKKGETEGFAEYFTAHRLAEGSYRMVSKSFKDIITKCLQCDFGHNSDFASLGLQQAFYHDVISGLENLENTFRELQLDDPEPA
ncbi:unnamed protein product [Penicillium olsonii]|nr:unnamed protein product [Penicillium olsonii]